MKNRILVLLAILILGTSSAYAAIELPGIFGDHMVLQQEQARVWGKAKPGAKITVTVAGVKALATADRSGKWSAELSGLEPGGPHDLTITGDGSRTITDVLVGDVWLGSGQSNMEFPMSRTHDAAKRIAEADRPMIRLFTQVKATSDKPLEDVKGTWSVCTPATVPNFSAVAYHFGLNVHNATRIPVGLVANGWGGSNAESWLPEDGLKDSRFKKLLDEWARDEEQAKGWGPGYPYELQIADVRLVAKDRNDPILLTPGKGLGGKWDAFITAPSTGAFKVGGKAPGGAATGTLSGLMKGQGWITLTTNFKEGTFDLTPYERIEYKVRGRVKYRLKFSQASISDYNYHSTDILTATDAWQDISIPIAQFKQGDWGIRKPFTPDAVQALLFNPEVPYVPNAAYVMYHGMIAPLSKFALKGVLWYQGESNAGRGSDYEALMTNLIASWRKAWGKDLPFLIVQLTAFTASRPEPGESGWAEIREAQAALARKVPGVASIPILDLGEADDIHPRNKTEVGRRLAQVALAQVYGKKVLATGPLFEKAEIKGSKMILTFSGVGSGLSTMDGKPVTGFALSGPEGDFHWARAKITGRTTVEVWNDAVKIPVGVRYAWADNPRCNLSNKEKWPASSFRFGDAPANAGVGDASLENWKTLSASNGGVYKDTTGTTIAFAVGQGPEKGQKALKLTWDLKAGGFCGLWHNVSFDLTGKKELVFQAKSTLPGEVQLAMKDKWNVQYIALARVASKEWTEVRVPLASFKKDPYYTPPEAVPGHPMDLSKVGGFNFGPQAVGAGEIWIGPVAAE